MQQPLSFAQLSGQTDDHCVPVPNQQALLHPLASEAFVQMRMHAADDGIGMDIASGFRSFHRQLRIWNRKWRGDTHLKGLDGKPLNIETANSDEKLAAILHWSALPGASRHHWGTDLDVYDPRPFVNSELTLQLEPEEYCQTNGPCYSLWRWLCQHAEQYGFFFPYARYQGGVAQEPWHLSYRPIAATLAEQLRLEDLKRLLSDTEIEGQREVLSQLANIKTTYIDNINEAYGWNNIGSG